MTSTFFKMVVMPEALWGLLTTMIRGDWLADAGLTVLGEACFEDKLTEMVVFMPDFVALCGGLALAWACSLSACASRCRAVVNTCKKDCNLKLAGYTYKW